MTWRQAAGGVNRGQAVLWRPTFGVVAIEQQGILDRLFEMPCGLSIEPFSCATPRLLRSAPCGNARTAPHNGASDRAAYRRRDCGTRLTAVTVMLQRGAAERPQRILQPL